MKSPYYPNISKSALCYSLMEARTCAPPRAGRKSERDRGASRRREDARTLSNIAIPSVRGMNAASTDTVDQGEHNTIGEGEHRSSILGSALTPPIHDRLAHMDISLSKKMFEMKHKALRHL